MGGSLGIVELLILAVIGGGLFWTAMKALQRLVGTNDQKLLESDSGIEVIDTEVEERQEV